jgi:hypothetical protein
MRNVVEGVPNPEVIMMSSHVEFMVGGGETLGLMVGGGETLGLICCKKHVSSP